MSRFIDPNTTREQSVMPPDYRSIELFLVLIALVMISDA
jgi:hypothetical protein